MNDKHHNARYDMKNSVRQTAQHHFQHNEENHSLYRAVYFTQHVRRKKGTMQQAFIYIMAILVIGFIMLIGIKSFIKINEGKCTAERVTFQRELTAALQRNEVWGREEQASITKPCDYEALCFADARTIHWNSKQTNPQEKSVLAASTPLQNDAYTNLGTGANKFFLKPGTETVIKDSVESGIEKNIFIVRKNIIEPIDYSATIELTTTCDPANNNLLCPSDTKADNGIIITVPTYVFCVPARAGKFFFTLQGQGKTVKIVP